jgi:hypothetical protein
MQIDNSPEAPFSPLTFRSDGLRWLACITAALITAMCVFDTTAGAAQRVARLMEMARPACNHSGITNEELHDLVWHEVEAGTNKKDALRAVVIRCQTKLRVGLALLAIDV